MKDLFLFYYCEWQITLSVYEMAEKLPFDIILVMVIVILVTDKQYVLKVRWK